MNVYSRLRKKFSNLYYGWVMVGVVSAMRMFGGGLHGYGFTVFFLPVSHDLGLNRAQTSLAFSLARAEGAIEAPLIGYLVDRFGPRPLMVTAALLAGIGYISLSWVNGYWGFLAVYLGLISLAYSAGFIQTPMVVANNWFIRRRARNDGGRGCGNGRRNIAYSATGGCRRQLGMALGCFLGGLHFSFGLCAAEPAD